MLSDLAQHHDAFRNDSLTHARANLELPQASHLRDFPRAQPDLLGWPCGGGKFDAFQRGQTKRAARLTGGDSRGLRECLREDHTRDQWIAWEMPREKRRLWRERLHRLRRLARDVRNYAIHEHERLPMGQAERDWIAAHCGGGTDGIGGSGAEAGEGADGVLVGGSSLFASVGGAGTKYANRQAPLYCFKPAR